MPRPRRLMPDADTKDAWDLSWIHASANWHRHERGINLFQRTREVRAGWKVTNTHSTCANAECEAKLTCLRYKQRLLDITSDAEVLKSPWLLFTETMRGVHGPRKRCRYYMRESTGKEESGANE